MPDTLDSAENLPRGLSRWDFAGWGNAKKITDIAPENTHFKPMDQPKHLLGTLKATAICGNDISSSCLYVSALCAAQAGTLAPVVLLIVGGVLYLFRKVYAEVGSALPLNGGTYTVLLNTTNKRLAAAAAVLTLISYVATAVISANEAIHYLHSIVQATPVMEGTVVLLGLFALLSIIGIGESAVVAVGIFIFHLITLTLLCVLSIVTVANNPSVLSFNFSLPTDGNIFKVIVFGFAAAMLGISGFESSANFIEEQKQGVFPKTLRNMWLVVMIFNPLISFLSFGLIGLEEIQKTPPDLLARMGRVASGDWLGLWISIDAVLVLSGAVLTSFVGTTGLTRRMSLDRCLPQFLLRENAWRKTNHWIVLSFFAVCLSILFVTQGDIGMLAGVYTLSFLCVMALFAIGNMLLKTRRAQLPRETKASWATVIVALIAVVIGLIGNVVMDPVNLEIFVVYYFLAGSFVAIMFLRVQILKGLLYLTRSIFQNLLLLNKKISHFTMSKIKEINELSAIYFTAGDNEVTLNHAALYVMQNEQTSRLIVVHVYKDEKLIPPQLAAQLHMIDRLYPKLRIDFLAVKGEFSPQMIEALSERLGVPKNYMFIGTPGDRFPHRIETLGGVRVIL